MLHDITPVLLTYNEEENLDRTLAALTWAADIVILDSFSTDATSQIAKQHKNVRLFKRAFDTHADQWNFAIKQTNIKTDWILALDADYVLTPDGIDELSSLQPDEDICGYRASFRYLVAGVPLRGTLYPPVTVLFRRGRGRYLQDGHTQRLFIDGSVETLRAKIDHDDRKSLSHWLASQDRYSRLEASKLEMSPLSDLSFPDKVRKISSVAPLLVFSYCYVLKGIFLDGKIGMYYALQRLLAEVLLSLRLTESQINKRRLNEDQKNTKDVKHRINSPF